MHVDAHVDLPYAMGKEGRPWDMHGLLEGPFTLPKAGAAGVTLFVTALYCPDAWNGAPALAHFLELLALTRRSLGTLPLVLDCEGLRRVLSQETGMGTLFLLENADLLADPAMGPRTLRDEGVRLVGLTHMGRNRLADGNAVAHPQGLTDTGRRVVREIAEAGLLLDVAHLHPRCFEELLDLFPGPLVSTHTGVRACLDTPRNLSLAQVREIVVRKGVVGIAFSPEMLTGGPSARIEDVCRHIDTLVQTFGPKAVGIGSDFWGYRGETLGLEDIAALPALGEALLHLGYPGEAVEGILGGNWAEVFRDIL